MPIFSKAGERVYFAHIPKTAGSAIYLLFLRNGWSLANVQTGLDRRRIGYLIWKEFGIKDIEFIGERYGYNGSLQHAPAEIWTRWGPFTSSFAISRHPYTRFRSAMKYFYGLVRRKEDFAAFKAAHVKKLRHQFANAPQKIKPLFKPQIDTLAPDTWVLRYEDDWLGQMSRRYDLGPSQLERVNVTRPVDGTITDEDKAWIAEAYAQDFERLGYTP
jgi:hypothetical protein